MPKAQSVPHVVAQQSFQVLGFESGSMGMKAHRENPACFIIKPGVRSIGYLKSSHHVLDVGCL